MSVPNPTQPVTLQIKRLAHGLNLPLPSYQTAGAAGADVLAALPAGEDLIIMPQARVAVPTGIALSIPEGFEVQIRPRSGLARRHGLTVLNAPGTVDSDYRGEIIIMLINLGSEPVSLRRGDRIAQMILAPVTRIAWVETEVLNTTERGVQGFGSTGRG